MTIFLHNYNVKQRGFRYINQIIKDILVDSAKAKIMKGTQTFSIIKPNVVLKNKVGEVLSMMEKAGFRIVALKKTKLTKETAGEFYEVHRGKEFFERLINFMVSGPIYVMVLEKENAVTDFRTLVGSTNPEEADEGTIRKAFADDKTANAVHGSDSDENAKTEAAFFFSNVERF